MHAIRIPQRYDLNVKSSLELKGLTMEGASALLLWRFTAAGAVLLIPFRVDRRFPAVRMAASNGTTVSGNTQMAILEMQLDGADWVARLLANTAAEAQSGSGLMQPLDLVTPITLYEGLYFKALSNSGTTGQYRAAFTQGDEHDINMLGCRAIASGGIVDEPTIVDVTTAHVSSIRQVPHISILGFASNELVAR